MLFGEYQLPQRVVGHWSFPGFPYRVRAAGRVFERARWKKPHPGVVEQYREVRPRNSAHLKVYTDGTWRVDHIDDDNPDRGRVIEHGLNDTTMGKVVKGAAIGGAVVGTGYVLGRGLAVLGDLLFGPKRRI